jgi:hypothetical protein
VGTAATALPETIGAGGLTFQPRDHADLARQILNALDSAGDRSPFAERQDFLQQSSALRLS